MDRGAKGTPAELAAVVDYLARNFGADSKVTRIKVGVGRRVGDRIEIAAGLDPTARVVATGGGFLGDGDTVRVVAALANPAASAASAPASAPK